MNKMMGNKMQDQGTQDSSDPMQMMDNVMSKIDGFIKAGGASVDDLDELKMDLQDMMSEESGEPDESGMDNSGMNQEKGMPGLIIRIQNKGKGE